jgi:myo-inositol-1(or 4)-monophosphatase
MFEPSTELGTIIGAARSAGERLMHYFHARSELQVRLKGPADFVSTADLESERTLKEILLGAYPGRGFLAEESAPVPGAGKDSARYIIDPLDGTSNFLHGVPHFAVSIALEREGRVVAGVVLDPAKDETFAAEEGRGAWLNGARLAVSTDADFSRALIATGIPHASAPGRHARYLPMLAGSMRRAAGIRRLGAAALDLAYVGAGRFAVHFELALKPWDIAAGALIVKEAGGEVTDFSGGESYLATGNVVATNGRLHPRMLAILGPPTARLRLRRSVVESRTMCFAAARRR